jgi:uncharacterized protein (DUF1697 family)
VFDGGKRTASALEKLLTKEANERMGLDTEFFVYDAAQWQRIIAANPMREEAERDPSRFVVMFLRNAPDAGKVRAMIEWNPGREIVRAVDRQLYIVYPDGQGRSRLTGAIIERKLGTSGTARNWNTVTKLGALTSPA